MKDNELTFALALNSDGVFSKNHFGDADVFVLCKYENNKIIDVEPIPNVYKNADESTEHGSKSKGKGITSYLKEKGVRILVSMQFGKNIKIVAKHFVPVIIRDIEPNTVKSVLVENINMLEDALKFPDEGFRIFNVSNGIMKSVTK